MLIEEFGDEYRAYLRVKDQMGPCGITCATCDLGNGTVAEIASKLKQYLQMYGISTWAPQLPSGSYIDFSKLDKSLSWVHTSARCFGCEQGAPPDCAIRKCSKERGYDLCSRCPDLEGCTKFDLQQLLAREAEGDL